MSRRSLLAALLSVSVLVPAVVNAQEPSPSGSVEPSAAASPAPSPEAVSEPASDATPDATPGSLPEPDFQVGKWELQKLKWKDLRLNGGDPLAFQTVGPQDERGVPMAALGRYGRLVYNPTVVAQQGMKRLDTYKRTGKAIHLRQARKYLDILERLADGGKRRRWQPHWYELGVHDSGWVNSNSHGLALSFLSRYYRLTGAEDKLEQARLMLNAFKQRPRNQRWFSDVTGAGYIWFEHWPDGTKNHTLNAHINALFGLYDYWVVTGDPLAEQYFLGGAKTVRDKLYRFRRKGELSRYSLASTVGTVHYHETHILQLRILAKMTGDQWFDRQADRFQRDGETWKARHRGAIKADAR